MLKVLTNNILSSPEVQKQIDLLAMSSGQALSTWTQIEYYTSYILSNISGMADEQTALLVMKSIITFDTRLAIIDTVFARSAHTDDLKAIWDRLSVRIRGQSRERNQVAHFQIFALWKFSNIDGGPEAVFVPFHSPADAFKDLPNRLTVEQILEMRDRWQQLALAAQWLNRQLEPPKPYFEFKSHIPEPPLINELRASAIQSQKTKKTGP